MNDLVPPTKEALANPQHSGWLSKRGELNRAWQERWCVVLDATLWYFKAKTDTTPLKGIKLDQCVVRQAESERGRPFCFEIVTKLRAFVFAAESRASLHKWVEELAACTTLQSENLLIERAEYLIRNVMQEQRSKLLAAIDATPPAAAVASPAPVVDSITASVAMSSSSSSASSSSSSTAATAATSTTADVQPPRRVTRERSFASAGGDESVTPSFLTKREWALEAMRAGSFEVARDLLLELLDANPKDRNVPYDLACAMALLRQKHDAFRFLELALKNGFLNTEALHNDPDLNNIRTMPEWQPMIARYNSALHICNLMRQPETGVETRKRLWMQKAYDHCFFGKDAVDWLIKNRFADTRESATSLGRDLLSRGLIRPLGDDREFEDGSLFYVFNRESDERSAGTSPPQHDDDEIVMRVVSGGN
jgi:hypothetical protein